MFDRNLLYYCLFLVLFVSCNSSETVSVKINRFDSELFRVIDSPMDSVVERQFASKYADFLPIYIKGVLRVQPKEVESSVFALRQIFRDSSLMAIYRDEQLKFADLSSQENELSDAITLYKSWFPKDSLPRFQIHLSGLSQSAITFGELVSVAGDKYLGKDYPAYKSYFYSYQLPLMRSENLVPDALKAFLQGRFPEVPSDVLLNKMIYQGAISAAVSEMLPDIPEERILGFDSIDYSWLTQNEKNVWIYMAENEQLFATDPLVASKYMDEAPFTSYFGQKSPSRIGRFMGYRIVKSYLKKQSVPISELLERFNAKTILEKSGYRP